MSKAKPFLFGTALGASAMFVALQYHVVHSHDGFQMIPRTPQQSVGLAYADIRSWSPSQWTDRPELARALMAHGASDLISESVTNTLADSVSEENSTLEELRAFLNKSESGKASEGASDRPDQSATGSSGVPDKKTPDNDLFRIPFPQDAKTEDPADPFRVARTAVKEQPLPTSGSRFSTADVLEGLNDDPAQKSTVERTAATPSAAATPAKSGKSVAEQAQEMENRIFRTGSKAVGKPLPESGSNSDAAESMFEDVSTQLENRAQEALNRAKQVVSEKTDAAAAGSAGSSESFIRSHMKEVIPDSAKSSPNADSGDTPKSATSILKDFDPFLE